MRNGIIPIRSASLYGSEASDHKISDKLAVYVVRAKEIDRPAGIEASRRKLLTNVPVNSFDRTYKLV